MAPTTNPPTKDKLESGHFLKEDKDTIAALERCLRVDPGHFGRFSPPSRAIQAIREGLMLLLPRFTEFGMKEITDPPNTYKDSTAAAVLVYKQVNGIQRVGQPMDDICGRGTLARLDTELSNPLPTPPGPKPAPGPTDFKSDKFSYHFFLIKDGSSVDCSLLISSRETPGSRNFTLTDVLKTGLNSCECDARGTFVTNRRIDIREFGKSAGIVSLTRLSRTLRGVIDITDQKGNFDGFKFFLAPTPEKITFPTDGTLMLFGTWEPGL